MSPSRPGAEKQSELDGGGEPGQPRRPRRGRQLLVAGALGVVFEACFGKGEPSYDAGRRAEAGAGDVGAVAVASPDAGAADDR